ncbi:MAG: dicarboxylate/amino acid:cation symporter [Candidatus Cellulosilyticum pullistercoris]|uniref:Dicarboxylate/amino acid:cation symporter n=1 Tax=Candidatus Cellulosilyticum pullistercoris TaxID=2838521 RepID=A0A9E2NLI7_9FIRM|nr:dicarboxylate/amino acid:cation symporter [Candidatus Cellulosilyticum pullistercoris]
MTIALVLAVVVGTLLIFFREYLIAQGKEPLWEQINRLFFVDISTEVNGIGIFYILGQLFINALQLIIIPMVFSSIAIAMCHISDTKKLGRLSGKTLLGFLTTSVFALVAAGTVGYTVYKLGLFNVALEGSTNVEVATGQNPLMVIVDTVPNNIFNVLTNNGRVLAVVFLAVVTGLCINAGGEDIKVLKNILLDVNKIINIFLNFVILKFSPIAVFILITRTFAVYGIEHLKPALVYVLTTCGTALAYLIIAYPLYVFLATGLNPFVFMKKIAKVALLGFSANSSAAALSLNERTTVGELGVDKDIAAFILPLGMTVNMNGTAITQVIATIFIAASSGYSLELKNIIVIAVLALIASVGTPAAPGASAIILFSVLNSMGYNNPATIIAYSLIIAINRPVDMVTTSLNVTGDAATAVVVAASEGSLDKEVYYS